MNLSFQFVNDTTDTLNYQSTAQNDWSWTTAPPQQVAPTLAFNCALATTNDLLTSGSIQFAGPTGQPFTVNWNVEANTVITVDVEAPSGYVAQHRTLNSGLPIVHICIQQDEPNWMENMAAEIGGKPLREVCLPGTHDSATLGITNTSSFTPDEPTIVGKIKGACKKFGLTRVLKDVVADWAISQPLTIAEQLSAGIRYFDLRLYWDADNNDIYICHALTSIKMSQVVAQVLAFAKLYPKEIVLLDFNHGYNFDCVAGSASSMAFAAQIERLSNNLITTSEGNPGSTIQALWNTGKSVIAFKMPHTGTYKMPQLPSKDQDLVWPESLIWSHWPAVHNSTSELYSDLNGVIANTAQQAGKVWVLQCILTPGQKAIEDGVLSKPSTLLERGQELNNTVQTWLTTDWKNTPLNIIILDNAFSIPYLSIVKSLNRG